MIKTFAIILIIVILFGSNPLLPTIPAAQSNREKAIQYVSDTYGIPANQLQVVYETTRDLPLLNKHLYTVKVFDNQSRQAYQLYIDASTNKIVNYDELKRQEAKEYSDRYGKMSVNLFLHSQTMRPNDTVEVWIWLTPLDESIIPPRAQTSEDAFQRVAKLKDLFAEKEKPVIAWLENRGLDVTYASKYAPLVFANLTKQAILELQQRADVAMLDITGEVKLALDTVASTARAQPVWNKGINGSGIKVAVVETYAIVDNHTNLKRPIYFNSSDLRYINHTTRVAGIIASNHTIFKGLAHGTPTLLSANAMLGGSNIVSATEWALDQGADVINNSWGTGQSRGAPDSWSMYEDHVVEWHHKTVVAAAGNNGTQCTNYEPWVASPALGYNVISVGGFLEVNNGDWRDDSMWSGSCWNQTSPNNDRQLPNVVAVAGLMNTTSIGSNPITVSPEPATSFATPQVSAEAALLMQANSSLKYRPEAVRAIIMASSWHNIEGNATLSEYDGAGGIDVHRAYETVSKGWWAVETPSIPGGFPRNFYFNANAGDKVRFAISWLSHPPVAHPPTSDPLNSDIDLYIYSPTGGNTISYSNSIDNSYEIVQFTAPATGTYNAYLTIKSSNATAESVGYAWSKIPAKWDPKTIPSGFQINMQSIGSPSGTPVSGGWSVDTIGGNQYSYDFMGWASTKLWKVPSDRKITVGGYFFFDDTFPSYERPLRSYLKYYVLNTAGDSIIKSGYVIDWNQLNNVWYYRDVTITDLTPNSNVRLAFGRSDQWATDYRLKGGWSDIYVNAEEIVLDFAVSVSPSQGGVMQGSSIQAQVNVSAVLGVQPTVTLSATGLPSGTTVSFNPSSGTPSFLSTMTITTSPTTPTGTYPITIYATGGGLTRNTTYQLTVTGDTIFKPAHWASKTIPSSHYVRFQNISTPYGSGWQVDTIGSGDYGYDFMGYTDKNTLTVKSDGTIRFTGYFLFDDTFPSYERSGRSYLKYYVLNQTGNTILKSGYVIDWTYANNVWYFRDLTVSGLTAGSNIRLAFGRSDQWATDYSLKAEWADITTYSAGMQMQGSSGPGASLTSPTAGSSVAPRYSLNLTLSTATVKPGVNITSTLTVTWLDKISVPLKVSVTAPQGFIPVVTPVSVSNSTTTYIIVVIPIDPKTPAGTYQVTVTTTADCSCTNNAAKSATLLIKVEG